jgi:molybdenum cofactor cytidylyltransferase
VSDTTRTASLTRALGLEQPSGVVAIVGGGGKSSLMFALAGALPRRTVMTTTTRIFAAQMEFALEVCTLADAGWRERLDAFDKSLLVVGRVEGDRAVGVPRELPALLCARAGIDQVVVEADGSRMRPVKAPAAHEPVIPDATSLLVVVAGIDALSGPIREVAHRPERVGAITGLDPEQALTPDALVRLLTSPEGGLKGAPPAARVAVLINKVESPEQRDAARRVARGILREPRVERVAIGALQDRATWDWEICRRREP